MKLIIIFSLLTLGVSIGCTASEPPVAENNNCPYITPISFIAATSDIEPTVRMIAWWSRITTQYPQLSDMYGEEVPLEQTGKMPSAVLESLEDLKKAKLEGCESLKVSDNKIEGKEGKEEFVASQEVSQPRQIYGYFSATNLSQAKTDSDCMPEKVYTTFGNKDPMLGLEFSSKNWVGIEKAVLCYWNELHLQQQYPSHLLVKISDSVLPTGSDVSSSCTLVPSHKFNSAKWVERWPQHKSKPQSQQLEVASLKYSDRLAIFDYYQDGFGILPPSHSLPHGWLGIGHVGQAQQYYFSPRAEVQLPGSGNNQQQSPVYGDTENISVFFDYVLNGTCFSPQ